MDKKIDTEVVAISISGSGRRASAIVRGTRTDEGKLIVSREEIDKLLKRAGIGYGDTYVLGG